MTYVEAELKRRDEAATLQSWRLVTDAASSTGLADPVLDAGARTRLDTIITSLADLLTELQSKYESGGLTNTELRAAPLDVNMAVGGNVASDATLLDVKRGLTDFETRLDYDVRTDGNPVYVGKALNGTATTAGTWVIQKLAYDASARLTRAQVLTGSWDGRAGLAW